MGKNINVTWDDKQRPLRLVTFSTHTKPGPYKECVRMSGDGVLNSMISHQLNSSIMKYIVNLRPRQAAVEGFLKYVCNVLLKMGKV